MNNDACRVQIYLESFFITTFVYIFYNIEYRYIPIYTVNNKYMINKSSDIENQNEALVISCENEI